MSFLEKLRSYIKELGEDEDDFEEEDPVPGAQTSSTNLDRKAEPKETHDHGTKQKAANKLLESVPPVEQIEVFRPSRYEDCQQIADALKVGHAAVVDYYYTLESTAKNIRCFSPPESRRAFLSRSPSRLQSRRMSSRSASFAAASRTLLSTVPRKT